MVDGFVASIAFLCLAGIVAVVGANGCLKQAEQEFQSRLRNAALGRARQLLVAALLVWGSAGLLLAFATPETATASARSALPPAAAAGQPVELAGEPVQLRIDQDINFTGR